MMTDEQRRYLVRIEIEVELDVPDAAIRQVLENWDDNGDPRPIGEWRRGDAYEDRGWQDVFYSMDEEGVVGMLAWWYGVQGRTSIDGFANFEPGDITGEVVDRHVWSADRIDQEGSD